MARRKWRVNAWQGWGRPFAKASEHCCQSVSTTLCSVDQGSDSAILGMLPLCSSHSPTPGELRYIRSLAGLPSHQREVLSSRVPAAPTQGRRPWPGSCPGQEASREQVCCRHCSPTLPCAKDPWYAEGPGLKPWQYLQLGKTRLGAPLPGCLDSTEPQEATSETRTLALPGSELSTLALWGIRQEVLSRGVQRGCRG